MEQQVSVLMEALRLARHKQFGTSSKKISKDATEQLSFLFNEVKARAQEEPEEHPAPKASRKQHKKHQYTLENIPKNTPTKVVEHPRLPRRFAHTIERTYSTCSWMTDDAFQYAISDALDLFLGTAPEADIY